MCTCSQSERLEGFCLYTISCVKDMCPMNMKILASKMEALQMDTKNNATDSFNMALTILILFKFSKFLRPSP
jgi:hypothetical protein